MHITVFSCELKYNSKYKTMTAELVENNSDNLHQTVAPVSHRFATSCIFLCETVARLDKSSQH